MANNGDHLAVNGNAGNHAALAAPPEPEEKQGEQEEYDRYKDHPELLGIKRTPRRLFSYDWANNYVSPFRPTPEQTLAHLLDHVDFGTGNKVLLDLGCGDGIVLAQALRRYSGLKRVIGIDLDQELLTKAKDKLEDAVQHQQQQQQQQEQQHLHRQRAELYCGDLTNLTDPIKTFFDTTDCSSLEDEGHHRPAETVGSLIQQSSHLFVYHLPAALEKLGPVLLEAVEQHGKTVLSMQWEVPALAPYVVFGGPEQHYRIYKK
ncbi:hypothetical protein DFQ27_007021 [Actinomortierella ambigua]|uniref:Methyltransferase domain-containing protein n=1 Tax=Actinomortierella ambigua TaxID=1343610 RepID=A0A9P6PUR9_9FUNG|nr:hypothetical protein DFQ27_007021 [Actinomortierella ambigua]